MKAAKGGFHKSLYLKLEATKKQEHKDMDQSAKLYLCAHVIVKLTTFNSKKQFLQF